ncbi:MAG: glycosyltransferase family 4 protein [Bdellovibrionaceae bacterium]|nr:glycosyltransferase family 4 protein [Pseudobdellovibrionaceae bacterium]
MIVNFISGKDLGGPKQSFILYSKALQKIYSPICSVIRKGALLKPLMDEQNIKTIELNYLRLNFWPFKYWAINKIKKQLKPLLPKIIFVHKALDLPLVVAALPKTKVIGVIHSFSASNIEYADALIAVSEKVKQFLINKNYKKPIYVIPNITVAEAFPSPKNKALPSVPVIGAMGVFRRTKGFHTLIKALFLLKKKNVPFQAVIAGKGKLYYYLQYLRWRYNLQDQLLLKSWIANKNKTAFLDSIDLYVLSSKLETFGMVIIEAMARKKRVIATKCGGPEEILTDAVNGYLIPKKNSLALANKLEHLIKNPQVSQDIPEKAYQSILNNYSLEVLTNHLQNLLRIYL